MGIFRRQKKFKVAFTRILASMVAILGGLAGFSLLRTPEGIEEATPALRGTRNPASLQAEVEGAPLKKLPARASSIIELSCQKESYAVPRSARIRLKGAWCHEGESQHQTQIVNKTNGVEATVFVTKNRQFTTDYMLLNEGLNAIELTQTDAKGGILKRQVTIVMEDLP